MTRAEAFFRQLSQRGEIGHAYLLESSRPGQALKEIRNAARIIACEKGNGCGSCASCRAFDSGNHPDIITLQKAKDAYGVKEIRDQLVNDIGIRPYRFERKIYLIPDAESLSTLCQNVMLKTLEEPPSYGVILLGALNRQIFLPTVLSRLVCLSADVEEDPDEAAPRDTAGEGREAFYDFVGRIRRAYAADCMKICEKLLKKGLDASAQLDLWENALQGIYLAKGGVSRPEEGTFPNGLWQDLAEDLSDGQLKGLWQDLRLARDYIRANMKAETVVGLFCIKFRDALSESEEA